MHLGLFLKIKKPFLFQTLTLACNIIFGGIAVMCLFITSQNTNGTTRPVLYKLQKSFWRELTFYHCQPGLEESWWSSAAGEGNTSVPIPVHRSIYPMRGRSWTTGVYCGLFAFGLYKYEIKSYQFCKAEFSTYWMWERQPSKGEYAVAISIAGMWSEFNVQYAYMWTL